MEPLAVGVSSDADHIITPSKEGPLAAHRARRSPAPASQPDEIASWDLHATATPGDYQEVENLRDVLPESVLVTARKGTFGHGMGGGRRLGADRAVPRLRARRDLPDAARREGELNRQIAGLHRGLRLRPAAVRAAGSGRQAVDGRRRHQRLRHFPPLVGRRAPRADSSPLTLSRARD